MGSYGGSHLIYAGMDQYLLLRLLKRKEGIYLYDLRKNHKSWQVPYLR